jgi:hypothetical protein
MADLTPQFYKAAALSAKIKCCRLILGWQAFILINRTKTNSFCCTIFYKKFFKKYPSAKSAKGGPL